YAQDVEKIVGINSSAMRYYEKEGILPIIKRDANGSRMYTDENIEWLRFIKLLRATDMSIENIKNYVYLFNQDHSTIEKRRNILREHKKSIKNEIRKRRNITYYKKRRKWMPYVYRRKYRMVENY